MGDVCEHKSWRWLDCAEHEVSECEPCYLKICVDCGSDIEEV